MKNHVNTLRATASVYLQDIALPLFSIASIVLAAILALAVWLTYAVSLWWLLLLIPMALWCIIVFAVWIAMRLIVKRLAPRHMTTADRKEVRIFIDQLNGVAELAATPKVIIALRIAWDAIFKHNTRYLADNIHSARDLHRQYASLARRFHDTKE